MTVYNPGQIEVAERVLNTLVARTREDLGAVEVVLGRRGSGKSTTLDLIRGSVERQQPAWITTLNIQAPDVQPGENLMVPVLTAIHAAILAKRHRDKLSEVLEKAAKRVVEDALTRSESFRELAKDLAMSPEHFAHMMLAHHGQRQTINRTFAKYVDDALHGDEQLIVFVDDLDLVGDPPAIQAFFKDLHTLYVVPCVHWVLSFDVDRIILCLSPTHPSAPAQPDTAVGESIVRKLAPTLLNRGLRTWRMAERLDFPPREADVRGEPTIGSLLDKHEIKGVEFALPNDPRSLRMLHTWLVEQPELVAPTPTPAPAPKKPGKKAAVKKAEVAARDEPARSDAIEAKNLEFLRACASASRIPQVVDILEEDELDYFFRALQWQATHSHVHWRRLTRAIVEHQSLPPLPVPTQLAGLDADDLSDLLEAVLDHGLRYDYIEPLDLLTRLPTSAGVLDHLQIRCAYDGKALVQYFETPSAALRRALDLQRWSDAAQQGLWPLVVTPRRLWRDAHPVGRFGPLSMLDELALQPVHPLPHGVSHDSLLPRRLRALLLFIADLAAMPWEALSRVTRLWNPISMSRLAAGFLLTALSQRIIAQDHPWLADWRLASNSIEGLLEWHDGHIERHYRELFEGLEALARMPEFEASSSLKGRLTHEELCRVLRAYLGCVSLAGLVPGREQPPGEQPPGAEHASV